MPNSNAIDNHYFLTGFKGDLCMHFGEWLVTVSYQFIVSSRFCSIIP